MAVTITNTNYNGDVIKMLYRVLGVGNQVIEKGAAYLETGISTKRSIPSISIADNPMGTYETTPTGETADTDYVERTMTMVKTMLYETIDPVVWQDIWDEFKSTGATFTNLALNPQIMSAVMDLYKNAVGRQMAQEFWNGTTFITGIIPLAVADGNVVDVTNIGVITETNVFDVIQDVWDAIPDQFIEDDQFKIWLSTTDWRKAQAKNRSLSESTNGALDTTVKNIFLSKRIDHMTSIPANTVIACKGTSGQDSNLIFGFYATPDAELGAPIIDKVANNSRSMFVRVDFKIDANYRAGSEIVLYQGS